MPELPEVEVVRRGLERHAVGHTIERVTVLHPRPVRRHLGGPRDLADRLGGRTLVAARRRGKYLWLPLDTGDALLAHLGMSGQILVRPGDATAERHLRVTLELDASYDVRYVDQRMFGGLSLSEDGADLPPEIAHIARDPLDEEFDDDEFAARLRRKRTGVKRALLDQSLVSGIGNIYADEGLWRARLHYARPTETLRRNEVVRILAGVRAVMSEALAQGGTSFDAMYVNVNGESGYFERSLRVYGREGEPCERCGTPIRRDAFMNRSSYTCPTCQPRPRRARW
ncbi:MAG: bifunctional DNA-formamidopyrimidine glycosylase/DNA-(apurinic or apyrimidinic site) lyase [Nocardioidaceae bacterium]